jgi:hypothetical protein
MVTLVASERSRAGGLSAFNKELAARRRRLRDLCEQDDTWCHLVHSGPAGCDR